MRLTITCAALVFSAAMSAQTTNYLTSPPGYLSVEGAELTPSLGLNAKQSRFFGGYADNEALIYDDFLRGGGLKILTQIDYRLDVRQYDANGNNCQGRSFSSVQLYLGLGDLNGPKSKTMTANFSATPTMVFSSSMSWPTITANPSGSVNTPNQWGGASFPFASNFVFPGTTTLLSMYRFRGGQLANGDTTWTGNNQRSYLFDAEYNDIGAVGYYYISSSANACVDSFHGGANFSYGYAYANTYASDPGIATGERAGTVYIDTSTERTAPFQPVIQAYSIRPAAAAIPLTFTSCTNNAGNPITPELLVDLSAGFLVPTKASFNGRAGRDFQFPWNPAFAGARLYIQGAYDDTVTGQMSTTRRGMTQIVPQPPGKMYCMYNTQVSEAGQAVNRTAAITFLPMPRYCYQ